MPLDQVYTEMQEYVGDWVVTPPKSVLVLMCDTTYNNQEAHNFMAFYCAYLSVSKCNM